METVAQQAVLSAVTQCPLGIIVTDAHMKIVFANAAITRLFQIDLEQLLGQEVNSNHFKELSFLFGENKQIEFINKQGQVICLAHHSVEDNSDPAQPCKVHYLLDQSEQRRLNLRIHELEGENEKLRLSDSTTGLFTERALLLALEPQLSRCRRYNHALSVISLDVEFTPALTNEVTIERCALQISQQLKDQLRWADLIARVDTHRFVVVLPETTESDAGTLIDKINNTLRNIEGVSAFYFGITAWKRGDGASSILVRAREENIRSKEQQKNTLTTH